METIEKAANAVTAVAIAAMTFTLANRLGCFNPIKKKWKEICEAAKEE